MSSIYDTELFKIASVVDETYDDLPVNLIDFKRHLKPTETLNKLVTMGANGRPEKADYTYNNEIYARIDFSFVEDANGLINERTETLYYMELDGSDGPAIIIKHKTYDSSNLCDGALVMQERASARKSIVNEIKAFTAGVLQVTMQCDIPAVVTTIKPFFDDHSQHLYDFIELGDDSFLIAIQGIDTTTDYTWLGTFWNAVPNTIQEYFISRLTY